VDLTDGMHAYLGLTADQMEFGSCQQNGLSAHRYMDMDGGWVDGQTGWQWVSGVCNNMWADYPEDSTTPPLGPSPRRLEGHRSVWTNIF